MTIQKYDELVGNLTAIGLALAVSFLLGIVMFW